MATLPSFIWLAAHRSRENSWLTLTSCRDTEGPIFSSEAFTEMVTLRFHRQ